MAYSDKDRELLAQLAEDPSKVPVMCEEHFYIGDIKAMPTKGCANCWKAYYFTQLANTPPSQHKQFMEELEMVVRKLVETVERRKGEKNPLGFELYEHPEIEIEKDAWPDKEEMDS
jgi:hypothetical protein